MKNNNYISFDNDIKIFRIGLGTNRIGNDGTSRNALKKAVELGINFIDTAAAYTGGMSEEIIGETLNGDNDIVIATKGGLVPPDFHIDSSPETLASQIQGSLKKLHLKTIPLYFLHRVDPDVPLKESVSFLKQMQREGKIKNIGLSQVTIEQIEEARKYVDIVAVENEYNLSERKYDDVIDYAKKENIIFIPFFPLRTDESVISVLRKLQTKYHATSSQIVLGWLLKRADNILPIPGTLSADHMEENVAAVKIVLSDEDFTMLSNS
jgi:pyridoxine 4-dehydrogenase